MSRSSTREGERCRSQAEPTVALAAVFAVAVGVSLYATVLADATPETDREVAEPTLERVHERLTRGGVTAPDRIDAAAAAGPPGYDLNVTLEAAGREWYVGPTMGTDRGEAGAASRRVSVRVAPGVVRSGRLGVRVRA